LTAFAEKARKSNKRSMRGNLKDKRSETMEKPGGNRWGTSGTRNFPIKEKMYRTRERGVFKHGSVLRKENGATIKGAKKKKKRKPRKKGQAVGGCCKVCPEQVFADSLFGKTVGNFRGKKSSS